MKILVDADACPVKSIIIAQAKKKNIPVTMIIDTSHSLDDGYSHIITVDKARDSVDIKLINLTNPNDIVVTQDFGLASIALAKHAKVINQNGLVYTNENIDRLLFERHLGQKARRSGAKTTNMKKRNRSNDESFEKSLEILLSAVKSLQ